MSNHRDIAIIGGGITGAGVALAAIKRGYGVIVHEQGDFGMGASTATSKLAHGGLRYLEQRAFRLVGESLKARNYLLQYANHAVKPLAFYVPLYKESPWRPWLLKLGLSVYDWLQPGGVVPKHHMMPPSAVTQRIPWLKSTGLRGCGVYYDAQMADHRLLIEALRMAEDGGAMIANHSPVTDFYPTENGLGYTVTDLQGHQQSYTADGMIVATGAWNNHWSNTPMVAPTKGVHIVLPNMGLTQAVLLHTPQDSRVFFVMPWEGKTLVGTTDDPDDGQYNAPYVRNGEADYLLTALNHYTTGRPWTPADIVSGFCGYRPLIASSEAAPSKRSREETYTWLDQRVLGISGGKYTTFLVMGEKAMDRWQRSGRRPSGSPQAKDAYFLGARRGGDAENRSLYDGVTAVFDEAVAHHLMQQYGALAGAITQLAQMNPAMAARCHPDAPICMAELAYAIQYEWAKTPDDVLLRRTYYAYHYANQPAIIEALVRAFYAIARAPATDTHAVCERIITRVRVGSV